MGIWLISPRFFFLWIHFTALLPQLDLVPKDREGTTLDHTEGRLGLSSLEPEPLPFGAHQTLQSFKNLGACSKQVRKLSLCPLSAEDEPLLAEASATGTLWTFCLTWVKRAGNKRQQFLGPWHSAQRGNPETWP